MDYKKLVTDALVKVLDGQIQEDKVYQLLEKPKSLELGDFAFPAFPLAKVMHKAPQTIAAEIVTQIDQTDFQKNCSSWAIR